MVRTVVYRQPVQAQNPIPEMANPRTSNVDPPPPPASTAPKDEFGDKLVKYIPAEVIAFFLPAYALAKSADPAGLAWLPYALVVVAGLGLVGYLLIRAPKDNPPRWYFYVLSVVAFLAWIAGTSAAGADVFHLVQVEITGKLILMAAVFAIPLLDELLTRFLP